MSEREPEVMRPERINREPEQDLSTALMAGVNVGDSVMANALATKEAAEAVASMIIAQKFPRDEVKIHAEIKRACARIGVASHATYSYNRGGQDVTGPTIRLATVIGRAFGHLKWGWKETDRVPDVKRGVMISKIRAFCLDKQTNTETFREFDVPHWRDTRGGGYAIQDERDIYELCANMASRRVRACLLEILPADIIDEARWYCEDTMKAEYKGRPLVDRIRDMLIAYNEIGVTKEMVAAKLQHSADAMTESEFIRLSRLFVGIKDDYTTIEKEFPKLGAVGSPAPADAPPSAGQPAGATRQTVEKKPRQTRTKPAEAPVSANGPVSPNAENGEKTETQEPGRSDDAYLFQIDLLQKAANKAGFLPGAFVNWAVDNKYDGVLPGKPLALQPIDVLIELNNFRDEVVEGILALTSK